MSFFAYWFLFPITLLVATVSMAVGVEVLGFLTPLLLSLSLSPDVAITTSLLTATFACGSSLLAYWPMHWIDFKLGARFLSAFVPATIIGVVLGLYTSELLLTTLLGGSLFAVAISFLRAPQKLDIALMNQTIEQVYGGSRAQTQLATSEGESFSYTFTNPWDGLGIAAMSGFFVGLVSNGLGELNSYFWVQRCRIPSQVAIATSMFVLTITFAIAAMGHGLVLIYRQPFWLRTVAQVILFTIPGAIIGGRLGSVLTDRMHLPTLERIVALSFATLGLWILFTTLM